MWTAVALKLNNHESEYFPDNGFFFGYARRNG
jgi:hypothetical protein